MTDATIAELVENAAPEHGDVPQYPIESVDNALKVLLLIGQRPSLGVTDVSQYLGVASSSAHRLLSMLQYRGFLRQDPATRAYVAGPSLDDLALGLLGRLDVRNRARPILERLNAEIRETVHLGRLQDAEVHFIDSIESTRAVRVGSRLGRTMPAHCTSTGKAILAMLTDDEIKTIFPSEQLVQLTPSSIGTRTDLISELATIRQKGYATSEEESEEGVSSIAVAIRGQGPPGLAVNASMPRSRTTAATQKEIRELVGIAAGEIASLLV